LIYKACDKLTDELILNKKWPSLNRCEETFKHTKKLR
jgi:hypothetical protein